MRTFLDTHVLVSAYTARRISADLVRFILVADQAPVPITDPRGCCWERLRGRP